MKKFTLAGLAVVVAVTLLSTGCASKKGPSSQSRVDRLERIHFDFDRSDIKPQYTGTMERNAQYTKEHANINVAVEGHCDERGTNEYNLALGDRRARSAKNYLVNLGVSSARLSTVSYGEERPLDAGHGEAGWSQNRRAEFVIR